MDTELKVKYLYVKRMFGTQSDGSKLNFFYYNVHKIGTSEKHPKQRNVDGQHPTRALTLAHWRLPANDATSIETYVHSGQPCNPLQVWNLKHNLNWTRDANVEKSRKPEELYFLPSLSEEQAAQLLINTVDSIIAARLSGQYPVTIEDPSMKFLRRESQWACHLQEPSITQAAKRSVSVMMQTDVSANEAAVHEWAKKLTKTVFAPPPPPNLYEILANFIDACKFRKSNTTFKLSKTSAGYAAALMSAMVHLRRWLTPAQWDGNFKTVTDKHRALLRTRAWRAHSTGGTAEQVVVGDTRGGVGAIHSSLILIQDHCQNGDTFVIEQDGDNLRISFGPPVMEGYDGAYIGDDGYIHHRVNALDPSIRWTTKVTGGSLIPPPII